MSQPSPTRKELGPRVSVLILTLGILQYRQTTLARLSLPVEALVTAAIFFLTYFLFRSNTR